MEPNNGAYYTLFAIVHMNTVCLDMKCNQTLARAIPCLYGLDVLLQHQIIHTGSAGPA